MNSTKKAARVAGLLYVLMGIPGGFSLLYVSSVLIVPGDATATINRIKTSELLFRVGMVSELICAAGFIFVALALYRLFKGVDKTLASLMVTLFVVSVPISFLNVLNQIAALTLLSGANFLSVFNSSQLNALVMLFLGLHHDGILLAQIFWGLWLLPFGVLVFKSGFLPRILGVLLIIACFGYLAISFTHLLLPAYGHIVSKFAMVLTLGELPIILWLLIKGAKDQPL
jgi:uncharacterized protein DUF4386